jgi:hypothetical protein
VLPASTRLFLAQISHHLVLLMSGIASVLMAAAAASFSCGSAPCVFWALGLLCLIVAAYRVWLDEHAGREVNAAKWATERAELLGANGEECGLPHPERRTLDPSRR